MLMCLANIVVIQLVLICSFCFVLLTCSDVLVAMQDSEAGLVLQQCQIQNKDYNNCFTGLHYYLHFYHMTYMH